MTSIDTTSARTGGSRMANWLLACVLLLGAASAAQAQSAVNCSDAPYFGVIDGDVYPDPPSQITIDGELYVIDHPQTLTLECAA